jgi:hypothetical protein
VAYYLLITVEEYQPLFPLYFSPLVLRTITMIFIRLLFLTFFALFGHSAYAITDAQMVEVMTFIGQTPNPNVNANGIGIYVYDGVNSMDALGPYRVFKSAGLNTYLIGQHKGIITTGDKLQLNVDKSIDEVKKLDILLIPGGAMDTVAQTTAPATLAWIKK